MAPEFLWLDRWLVVVRIIRGVSARKPCFAAFFVLISFLDSDEPCGAAHALGIVFFRQFPCLFGSPLVFGFPTSFSCGLGCQGISICIIAVEPHSHQSVFALVPDPSFHETNLLSLRAAIRTSAMCCYLPTYRMCYCSSFLKQRESRHIAPIAPNRYAIERVISGAQKQAWSLTLSDRSSV